jgi:uncharacterized protein
MRSDVVHLLDANVLIALLTPEHTLHERARSWFGSGLPFATCPITQGALLRFYMRWSAAASFIDAKVILQALCAHPMHAFWPDDLQYVHVPERGIRGHRQVTDAYLTALASAHNGVLATMDQALAVLQRSAVLI